MLTETNYKPLAVTNTTPVTDDVALSSDKGVGHQTSSKPWLQVSMQYACKIHVTQYVMCIIVLKPVLIVSTFIMRTFMLLL